MLIEPREEKNKIILEKIRNDVRQETLLTTQHTLSLPECFSRTDGFFPIGICKKKEPISIFAVTEVLFNEQFCHGKQWYSENIRKKTLWMKAIIRGHHERKKEFKRICNESRVLVRDVLGIKIPEDIMSLVFSFTPKYHINKESTKLINQAINTNKELDLELNLNDLAAETKPLDDLAAETERLQFELDYLNAEKKRLQHAATKRLRPLNTAKKRLRLELNYLNTEKKRLLLEQDALNAKTERLQPLDAETERLQFNLDYLNDLNAATKRLQLKLDDLNAVTKRLLPELGDLNAAIKRFQLEQNYLNAETKYY